MSNKLIILKEEKRWIAERILAAVFFAAIVYISYVFFFKVKMPFTEKGLKKLGDYLYVVITLAALGVYYSYQTHHHFDLKLKKYRTFYTVGPFGIGKWRSISNLSYVAINYITKENVFEVNIWDKSNNRFKVSYHSRKEEAKKVAKGLAKKVEIDYYEKDES